ncbi:hypothetical protein Hypma_000003 [Hypsizygus marmoreus]|uniref:Uncharacterized protein n=1 Tax=Hypsizygus marmoreus TaxID=39966 RepID=A0A369K920_HYPMA|nr:hypothetical protein Hypma_000003 [Hypsizygus marmoreus]
MQLSPSSAIDETVDDRGSYRPTSEVPSKPRHAFDLRKESEAGSGEGRAIKEGPRVYEGEADLEVMTWKEKSAHKWEEFDISKGCEHLPTSPSLANNLEEYVPGHSLAVSGWRPSIGGHTAEGKLLRGRKRCSKRRMSCMWAAGFGRGWRFEDGGGARAGGRERMRCGYEYEGQGKEAKHGDAGFGHALFVRHACVVPSAHQKT